MRPTKNYRYVLSVHHTQLQRHGRPSFLSVDKVFEYVRTTNSRFMLCKKIVVSVDITLKYVDQKFKNYSALMKINNYWYLLKSNHLVKWRESHHRSWGRWRTQRRTEAVHLVNCIFVLSSKIKFQISTTGERRHTLYLGCMSIGYHLPLSETIFLASVRPSRFRFRFVTWWYR